MRPESDQADGGAVRPPQADASGVLCRALAEGVVHGDARQLLPQLPQASVDLFFTSPPYADARAYSRIHPDRYVEWFLPFARSMHGAAKPTGSLIINIKNRVADKGRLKGQRHPYVYQLVLALQDMGWRWIETYIWAKPNAMPGAFGPRTKDSFEYVYHFARGARPFLAYPVGADTHHMWCGVFWRQGFLCQPIVAVCVNRIGKGHSSISTR